MKYLCIIFSLISMLLITSCEPGNADGEDDEDEYGMVEEINNPSQFV